LKKIVLMGCKLLQGKRFWRAKSHVVRARRKATANANAGVLRLRLQADGEEQATAKA
jgi:hypothetical protein